MSAITFGDWSVPSFRRGQGDLDVEIGEDNGDLFLSIGPAGMVGDVVQTARLSLAQAKELAEALERATFRAAAAVEVRGK